MLTLLLRRRPRAATRAGAGASTIARVDDGEPTVLETELMPGEAALLAPEWVPWSERLADYRAAQDAAAAAAREAAEAEGSADDER